MVSYLLKEQTSKVTIILSNSHWATFSLPYLFLTCSHLSDHDSKFQLYNTLLSPLTLGYTRPSLHLQCFMRVALFLALFSGFCHFYLLWGLLASASVPQNRASSQPFSPSYSSMEKQMEVRWRQESDKRTMWRNGLSLNFSTCNQVSF